ncbi:hypothetical protein [Acanthamoeba polyphaga mimivirus]|uniref:F-box and FNIP repeat-containing n=1 Tax=Acanthamoeba polyphaga mimivirus TaxID=212035 RepID=A0A2L2DKT6_MIMIV|nr:hypothetical protein [Acanthamoeba polyphaga mimivirus]
MSYIDILDNFILLDIFNYLSNKDKIMLCSVNKYFRLFIGDIYITSKYNYQEIKYLSHYIKFKSMHQILKDEIKYIGQSILYKPGSFRFKILQMRWDFHCGLNYYDIEKNNKEIFQYFGIDNVESLYIKINDTIKYLD